MEVLQRVRLKAASRVARDWDIAPGAEGAVLCRYRILGYPTRTPDRLDVRFSPNRVIWGSRADQFEVMADDTPSSDAIKD